MDTGPLLALTAVVSALAGSSIGLIGSLLVYRAARRYGRLVIATTERVEHMLTAPGQAWFWTPEWQAGEADADADLVAGRGVRFDSAEEFDAFLADQQSADVSRPVVSGTT